MICVPDRDDDVRGRCFIRRIIIDDIAELGKNDSRQFLLQKLISVFLEVFVDRQINVVARFRLCYADRIRHFSKIVYIYGGLAFRPLQDTVESLLQPGFSDDVRKRILLLVFIA